MWPGAVSPNDSHLLPAWAPAASHSYYSQPLSLDAHAPPQKAQFPLPQQQADILTYCVTAVFYSGVSHFFFEIIVRSVVVTASETDAVKLARRSFFVPLLHALRVGFAPWFFALVRSPSGSLLYDKVLGTGSQLTPQPLKTSLFIKVYS